MNTKVISYPIPNISVIPYAEREALPLFLTFGMSGSGKTHVGKVLGQRIGYKAVSMGDLFRESTKGIPRSHVLDEIKDKIHMGTHPHSGYKGIIIDNSPSSWVKDKEFLDSVIEDLKLNLLGVISVKASRSVCKGRLIERNRKLPKGMNMDQFFKMRTSRYIRHTSQMMYQYSRQAPRLDFHNNSDVDDTELGDRILGLVQSRVNLTRE